MKKISRKKSVQREKLNLVTLVVSTGCQACWIFFASSWANITAWTKSLCFYVFRNFQSLKKSFTNKNKKSELPNNHRINHHHLQTTWTVVVNCLDSPLWKFLKPQRSKTWRISMQKWRLLSLLDLAPKRHHGCSRDISPVVPAVNTQWKKAKNHETTPCGTCRRGLEETPPASHIRPWKVMLSDVSYFILFHYSRTVTT